MNGDHQHCSSSIKTLTILFYNRKEIETFTVNDDHQRYSSSIKHSHLFYLIIERTSNLQTVDRKGLKLMLRTEIYGGCLTEFLTLCLTTNTEH